MERQLSDGTHSLEALDTHKAMILVEPGAISFPRVEDMTPSAARHLCSVITAY